MKAHSQRLVQGPSLRRTFANNVGTQYRSAIYVTDEEQRAAAEVAKRDYQAQLSAAGGTISTEIRAPGAWRFRV